jgi:hypothetical protein
MKQILIIFTILMSLITSTYAIELNSCQNITTSGNYTLGQDLTFSGSGTCIDMQANDVSLNCDGYSITGDDSWSSIGINIYRSSSNDTNIEIFNCKLDHIGTGIEVENSNYIDLINLELLNNRDGLNLRGIYSAKFKNISISNSSENGFESVYLYDSILENLIIENSGYYGIDLFYSHNNSVLNSILDNNSEGDIRIYTNSR